LNFQALNLPNAAKQQTRFLWDASVPLESGPQLNEDLQAPAALYEGIPTA
jgi:hypothetical protein